ncbi:MAG TPA: zinc ABC transporter substrate-binding protein [Bacillota bacterium]|nr:zinc ABC transporter substrate-binding protein [Bacillota bacterium]
MILGIIVSLFFIAQSGWCETKAIVVASTSWTGAIAQAAGADEVIILAPFEIKHPAEYDYRPADLAKLQSASLIVYGGYEPFIKKMVVAADYPETQVVKVKTTNVPDNLIRQARLLAEKLGTQKQELKWEKQFKKVYTGIQQRARLKKVTKIRVLVQEHQQELVKWLGYDIVGCFGATELSPAKVMELAKLKPDLIIDNIHNPQGKPIQQIAECRYLELISFPSVKTPTLNALFEENARILGL